MLVDKFGKGTLANGVLRLGCEAAGGDGEMRSSGELVIPGNRIDPFVAELDAVVKRLVETAKQQIEERNAQDASGTPSA